MNAPNLARRLDDASNDFDVLEKTAPENLVNYSRSKWSREPENGVSIRV
jgi:hypothetical protein